MNPIEINFSTMKVGDLALLPANKWPCPHARKALEASQAHSLSSPDEVKPQYQLVFQGGEAGVVKGIERIR